jgi:CheY-like chemotaxis protein
MNALVVEDLPFWQDAVREVLTGAGHEVWVAASYEESLKLLAAHEMQLVVIDPVLDDTNRHNRDGLRVLRHILDERPDLRAIVITSSDPRHIQREVSEMSPDVPMLWKDEWDDERFLHIVRELFGNG